MKVLKIQQNSEEWEEFRKGKSGGSELKDLWVSGNPTKEALIEKVLEKKPEYEVKGKLVKDLMEELSTKDIVSLKINRNPKKKYYEMLAERVARPLTPNDYADRLNGEPFSAMARGHILEPEIADNFAKKFNKKLDEESVVWVSDNNPNSYISPDRTITSPDGKVREAVEIKALYSPKVLEIWKTKTIPAEYMPQIIKYFMVNEDLEKLYWVVGTDLIPGLELQVFTINREEIEDKIEDIELFEDALLSMIEDDVAELDKLSNF